MNRNQGRVLIANAALVLHLFDKQNPSAYHREGITLSLRREADDLNAIS